MDFFLNHKIPVQKTCPRKEEELHRQCVAFMTRAGWKLIRHEWHVVPGLVEHGVGDMVFLKGRVYCVIESKRITIPKVHEQSRFYAAAWKLLYARKGYIVVHGIWTCKSKLVTGVVQSAREAREICDREICDYLWLAHKDSGRAHKSR